MWYYWKQALPGRAGTHELQDYSPVPLFVGHIVWTEEIQLVLADDADVDVAARAQVIVDAGCDGISHELLGLLLLEWLKSCHCPSAGISQDCASLCLQRLSLEQ